MKRKIIIFCSVSVLIFTVFMVGYQFFQVQNKSEEQSILKDKMKEFLSSYEVVEEKDNGNTIISVEAPDLVAILNKLLTKFTPDELDDKKILKAILDNEELRTEYIFSVPEVTNTVIEEQYFQKISYEVMINAISRIEFKEEWSTEK